ncbi:AraC family transcriptional regulator [Paenibacillus frigoriresistens]|uniref:AraC family transcriptional regulator n=1 Tax=Paenibacillus alginolyticus TaxID=59839 RepID=UPI0015639AE7|nr:AraC family transcriptional regulator [Paenibacillus frigoriresistens]NRF89501.1 AraC family transcriptional regulator [Paenibacillus frigoriresistens]
MTIKRSIIETPGDQYFLPELPLYVNRVHESFEMLQHKHDFIEISYVAEGSGAHYIDNTSLPVSKGDLFFLPVGVSHVFRPSSFAQKNNLVVYNCIFTQEWLNQLFHLQLSGSKDDFNILFMQAIERAAWLSFKERNGEFQPLFERLHFEFSAHRSGFMTILQTCVAQLLVYMYRSKMDFTPEASKANLQDLDSLLIYIRGHCSSPISLKEAATRLSISERQLHRQLKKHTGMSFMEFVQHARIEACCQLLRTNDHKISDVAASVGYQDLKFFNHLFKKITGITPSQFRQQHR